MRTTLRKVEDVEEEREKAGGSDTMAPSIPALYRHMSANHDLDVMDKMSGQTADMSYIGGIWMRFERVDLVIAFLEGTLFIIVQCSLDMGPWHCCRQVRGLQDLEEMVVARQDVLVRLPTF